MIKRVSGPVLCLDWAFIGLTLVGFWHRGIEAPFGVWHLHAGEL